MTSFVCAQLGETTPAVSPWRLRRPNAAPSAELTSELSWLVSFIVHGTDVAVSSSNHASLSCPLWPLVSGSVLLHPTPFDGSLRFSYVMRTMRSFVAQCCGVIVIMPIHGCWVSCCAPGVSHVGTAPIVPVFVEMLAKTAGHGHSSVKPTAFPSGVETWQ